ncbi:MAG: hypothetical protein J6D36_03160 [Erysipelotrichaceae bacterium]|jgi:hypothetical protein|nr:hypothetical protein [Erysipelotrichaceae bacterium]
MITCYQARQRLDDYLKDYSKIKQTIQRHPDWEIMQIAQACQVDEKEVLKVMENL